MATPKRQREIQAAAAFHFARLVSRIRGCGAKIGDIAAEAGMPHPVLSRKMACNDPASPFYEHEIEGLLLAIGRLQERMRAAIEQQIKDSTKADDQAWVPCQNPDCGGAGGGAGC